MPPPPSTFGSGESGHSPMAKIKQDDTVTADMYNIVVEMYNLKNAKFHTVYKEQEYTQHKLSVAKKGEREASNTLLKTVKLLQVANVEISNLKQKIRDLEGMPATPGRSD